MPRYAVLIYWPEAEQPAWGSPEFNQLAKDGRLRDWVDAYNRGHVSVAGEQAVVKLVGNVIERQLARAGTR